VRLLRGDNIGQGQLRWDGVKRWPTELCADLINYKLREIDVVLAMDRPWIPAGLKFSKVRKADLPALLVQRVACLRPQESITADFLYYVVATRVVYAVHTECNNRHCCSSYQCKANSGLQISTSRPSYSEESWRTISGS